MEKALHNTPTFDPARFKKDSQRWKRGDGERRVVIEWGVGTKPRVFVFPAGERASGAHLLDPIEPTENDERWADFLEFEFVPQVASALRDEGWQPQIVCVDLRPLVVQRERRRKIEAAAKAKQGELVSLSSRPGTA